jgi:hypothetical protein
MCAHNRPTCGDPFEAIIIKYGDPCRFYDHKRMGNPWHMLFSASLHISLQTCRYEGRKFQGNEKKCLVGKGPRGPCLTRIRGSREMESSTVPILIMPCPKGLNRIRGSYEMESSIAPILVAPSSKALTLRGSSEREKKGPT